MAKKKNCVWKDRKHFMWFPFTFTKYCIRNDRLYTDVGFFNTVSDELLLYRVVDVKLTRSFRQKLFGTGTVILSAKVDSDPVVMLENIKRPRIVKEMISNLVETARYEKRVVGNEFYGGGSCPPPPPHDGCDCDHGMDGDMGM